MSLLCRDSSASSPYCTLLLLWDPLFCNWKIQCATLLCPHCCLFSVPQLFDKEGTGSLSEEELSGLMGALLGFPQHNTAELYKQASIEGRLTEGENSHEFKVPSNVPISGRMTYGLTRRRTNVQFLTFSLVWRRISAGSSDGPPHLSKSAERAPAPRGEEHWAGQWERCEQQWKLAQQQRVSALQEVWMKIL